MAVLSFGTLTDATLGGLAGSTWYFTDGSPEDTHRSPVEPGEHGQCGRGPDRRQQRRQHHLRGDIIGSGQLIKVGSGTLVLSGTNSDYSGGTTVLGGTLDITSVEALPAGSTLAVANTAAVIFAPNLAHAVQLSLLTPGASGSQPGMMYFKVVETAVPEPATWALLLAGALAGPAGWAAKADCKLKNVKCKRQNDGGRRRIG